MGIWQSVWNLALQAPATIFSKCGTHCSSQNFLFLLTSTSSDWGCLVDFLQDSLPQLFRDMKLQAEIHVWFMHDGSLPHFLLAVLEFFNSLLYGILDRIRWTNGMTWLFPRFKFLTFYLWGPPKSAVYATEVSATARTEWIWNDLCNSWNCTASQTVTSKTCSIVVWS
jgi:hypothetical protein